MERKKTNKSGYEWKLKDGRTVKLMIEIGGEEAEVALKERESE